MRERDSDCKRCHKALGLRSHEPDETWEFEGKLCHSCFEDVKKGVKEYEVTYVGGHSKMPVQVDGILSILLFDQINKIVFTFKGKEKGKDALHLSFKSDNIKGCRIVSKNEESFKKMIITAGFRKTTENRYLQIDFLQGDKQESLILNIGKELDEVSTTIGLLVGKPATKTVDTAQEESETRQELPEIKELAPQIASKPCMVCLKNNYSIYLKQENLCVECFESRFGRLILASNSASYYGGHKAFLAGGLIMKEEFGNLYLTDSHMIFSKRENNPDKRWQIVIPLKSIVIEGYGIEEKTRRQQMSGLGGSPVDGVFGGGGFIHESGKEHHLVVPYIDENGIPQAPRFGVTSFRGKAIREWASALYQQIVTIRKSAEPSKPIAPSAPSEEELSSSQKLLSVQGKESPLAILKTRLAKGEITKEEYEELRKMLQE